MVAGWKKGRTFVDEDKGDSIDIWKYESQNVIYDINVRHFFSDWGKTEQIIIKKSLPKGRGNEPFTNEPTMHEKNAILNDLNNRVYGTSVAFEIFPEKEKIVDEQELFHVWVVDQKKKIPFDTCFGDNALFKPKETVKINGIVYYYKMKTVNHTSQKVYYLWRESNEEMTWREKQNFKDTIIGENAKAIEVIRERENNMSVLVVLPDFAKIPFGLKPNR